MIHNEKQKLEKAQILANEVLKTVERCKDSEMNENEKAYHLSQIEALARDVVCDTGQYDEIKGLTK